MNQITLNTKSRKEIANDYGVNVRTLYRWIKKSNIMLPRGLITASQQQLIYNKFGDPKIVKES